MFTGQPPVFPFSKEKTMPRKIIETPQLSSPGQRLRQNLNRQSAGAPRGNQLSAPGQKLQQRLGRPMPVNKGTKSPSVGTGIGGAPKTGVAPGIKAPPSVTTGGGIKGTIGAPQKVGGNGTKPKVKKPTRKPLMAHMSASTPTKPTPSPTRQPRRERRPRGER